MLIRRGVKWRWGRWSEALLWWGLALVVGAGLVWEAAPPLPPVSQAFFDTQGRLIHVSLTEDGKWRLPPSAEAIQRIALFLLAKEDRHFWHHPGFWPPALGRALWQTLRGHRQGGSTLTMQLARLRRPGPRTFLRKLQEIGWAIGLELRYSKSELLRAYLTCAPFGGNVEGVTAAAWRYFGRPAERLTPLEIAALLLVSQRPRLRSAFLRSDPAFRRLALAWVRRWAAAGLLSPAEVAQAEATPLQPALYSFPRLPLHVLPACAAVQDTLFLSMPLQAQVAHRVAEHLRYWESCGIQQAAVVVAEAPTGKVIAYWPSRSYESCAIDLVQIPRAVGSTLKPFLWAEALERGLIHSATPLIDAPRSYEGYVPVNFDRTGYQGVVPAGLALQTSLNAPAVDLLNRVGLRLFCQKLDSLGLRVRPQVGYALITGAVEASLYELVQAYLALANGGIARPLRRRPADLPTQQRLWHEASTWIVSKLLRKGSWSYKTGTSARLRDAWCLAWNTRYVVGVWLGNPDGRPSGCLKGFLTAFPLAQEITQLLGESSPPPMPVDLRRQWVCAATGQLPGPACTHQVEAWSLATAPLPPPCTHERILWIDESYSYCSWCLPADTVGHKLQRVALPLLPWAILAQRLSSSLPPHFPTCAALTGEVLSPPEGVTFWVTQGGGAIPLEAVTSPLAPVLWGQGRDTLGWQMPGKPLLYRPLPWDTLLRFWAQIGHRKLRTWCRVRWFYHSSSRP